MVFQSGFFIKWLLFDLGLLIMWLLFLLSFFVIISVRPFDHMVTN